VGRLILEDGQRVEVWDGSKENYLGKGTIIGRATVYFIVTDEGILRSLPNAEIKPEGVPEEAIIKSEDNPKFVLDDGKTVYGCQVWWKPLSKTKQKK